MVSELFSRKGTAGWEGCPDLQGEEVWLAADRTSSSPGGFSWPGVQTGQLMLKPLDVSKVVVTDTRQSFALDLQPTSHLNHSESTSDLHRYGTFCVRNYSLNPRQQPCEVNATLNLHF